MADRIFQKLYFSKNWVSSQGGLFFVMKVIQLVMLVISRLLMPIFWAKVKVSMVGEVQANAPLLILVNHKSYYDPLVVCNALSKAGYAVFPIRFFSKDKLFYNWYSSWFYAFSGAFPAFYKQGLDKSLEVPKAILRKGGVVMMFPEGACIREDVLGEFKVGASILAKQVNDLWILPIAIHQSYKIKWRLLLGLPEVQVKLGHAFKFKDKIPSDDPTIISEALKEQINTLFKDLVRKV